MSTLALWRWTTSDGRLAMSRSGYCSVERVMVTLAMRPAWIWTLTQTSPRRLVPWPVKVPSLYCPWVAAAPGARFEPGGATAVCGVGARRGATGTERCVNGLGAGAGVEVACGG